MTLLGGTGAIRQHLFVLAPNNSGSTFLTRALGLSPGAWSLPREGQHLPGFAGPSSRATGTGLLWAATPERIAAFADPAAYDWARTRRAWHFHARAETPAASVLVIASPPFVLIADQLAQAFPEARFVLLVRNPWATAEGILRGTPGPPDPAVAARHLVAAFAAQRRNRDLLGPRATSLTYEAMCRDPGAAAAGIEALVPALGPVTLDRRIAVKGSYDEQLRDMNAEQIARLAPSARAAIDPIFAVPRELFAAFGYAEPPR